MQAADILKNEFPKVSEEDTVSKLVGHCIKYHISSALVFRGKEFIGIIDKKDLPHSKMNLAEMKMKHICRPCHRLNKTDNEKEMAKQFLSANAHILPVFEKGKFLGIVHDLDLLQVIQDTKPVGSIAKKARVIKDTDAIGTVLHLMHNLRIDRLPVVDKSGKLVGICSLSDMLAQFLAFPIKRAGGGGSGRRLPTSHPARETHLLDLPVMDVTNIQVITVKPNESIKNAIQLMQKNEVSSLVLEENGEVKGILTVTNLLNRI